MATELESWWQLEFFLYVWCFEQLDTPRQTYNEIDFLNGSFAVWSPQNSVL